MGEIICKNERAAGRLSSSMIETRLGVLLDSESALTCVLCADLMDLSLD